MIKLVYSSRYCGLKRLVLFSRSVVSSSYTLSFRTYSTQIIIAKMSAKEEEKVNRAAWLPSPGGKIEVGPAPLWMPEKGQLRIRVCVFFLPSYTTLSLPHLLPIPSHSLPPSPRLTNHRSTPPPSPPPTPSSPPPPPPSN